MTFSGLLFLMTLLVILGPLVFRFHLKKLIFAKKIFMTLIDFAKSIGHFDL